MNLLSIFNTFDIVLAVLVSVLVILFLVWFIRKVRISLAKSTVVGKGTIGPLEISSSSEGESNETNVFNIFSEELLYFFRKSRTKIIIFEDLDRFGKPEIFQELRELNININKRQPKVVFIYSLQDKVFESIIENEDYKNDKKKHEIDNTEVNTLSDNRVRSKAKFFDYVIPIFPVTSLYNSSSTLEEELNKYKVSASLEGSTLSKNFLRSMGFFLKDQRMIILIVSEYDTYLKVLHSANKKDIDLELLFSMIAYKNFYAEDFEKVSYGNSLLNKIFDYVTSIYTKLIDIKTENLRIQKKRLEERILNVENHINYDVSAILNSYYLKLKEKYRISDYNFERQIFEVNRISYGINEGSKFFSDIINLDDQTVIISRHQSYSSPTKKFFVKEALSMGEEIDDIRYLIEDSLEGKTISKVSLEIKKELEKTNNLIRDVSSETYQLTSGAVLRELCEMYDNEDELGQSLKEIKEDNFKRFLFFNDYLTPNFYSFISPVDFSENLKDSTFIEAVLSYNDMQDYHLIDVENVIRELDYAGANYSFAYSSNLLSYLFNIKEYKLQKSLILEKMIEKNDYVFWDSLLSYSNKNNLSIVNGLCLLAEKSQLFFVNSFGKVSTINNNFSVETLLENFNEVISKVGEAIIGEAIFNLINDSSSFYNIVNALSNLPDSNILDNHRVYFKVRNLLDMIEDPITKSKSNVAEYIYKKGLYESSYKNMENFGVLFQIESNFDKYTEKFKDINIERLDLPVLYDFFGNMYNDGASESYSGFEEFIDFSLRKQEFFNKFTDEFPLEIDIKKEKERCSVYFSRISFTNENYESNKRIVKKLDLDTLIINELVKKEVVIELINLNRISYSFKLVEAISIKFPDLITDYLLSIYTVYPDLFTDHLKEIQQFLTDKEVLYLLKNLNLQKDYLKMGALLTGNMEVWRSILQEEPAFFDDGMTTKILQRNDFSLAELLFKFSLGERQVRVLYELLTNFPGQLSLSAFEKTLNANGYLSQHLPYSRKSQKNEGIISEKIMDILDELGIIGYRNSKQDFIVKKDIIKYFS